jgi:hypothetical protein
MRHKPNKALTELKHFYQLEGESILIYPGHEKKIDPFDETKEITYLSPIPIKALVKDFSPKALVWKDYGIKDIGTKQVMIEPKYLSLIENCVKLKIRDEEYTVFKDAASNKLQIWQRAEFILFISEKI